MHALDAPGLIAGRLTSVARHRDLHPQRGLRPAKLPRQPLSRPTQSISHAGFVFPSPETPPHPPATSPRILDHHIRRIKPATPRRALSATPSTPPTRTSTIQHDASRMQEAGCNLTTPPSARSRIASQKTPAYAANVAPSTTAFTPTIGGAHHAKNAVSAEGPHILVQQASPANARSSQGPPSLIRQRASLGEARDNCRPHPPAARPPIWLVFGGTRSLSSRTSYLVLSEGGGRGRRMWSRGWHRPSSRGEARKESFH